MEILTRIYPKPCSIHLRGSIDSKMLEPLSRGAPDGSSYQVGTLIEGPCRPHIAPISLYQPYMSIVWGCPPGTYPPAAVLDLSISTPPKWDPLLSEPPQVQPQNPEDGDQLLWGLPSAVLVKSLGLKGLKA